MNDREPDNHDRSGSRRLCPYAGFYSTHSWILYRLIHLFSLRKRSFPEERKDEGSAPTKKKPNEQHGKSPSSVSRNSGTRQIVLIVILLICAGSWAYFTFVVRDGGLTTYTTSDGYTVQGKEGLTQEEIDTLGRVQRGEVEQPEGPSNKR